MSAAFSGGRNRSFFNGASAPFDGGSDGGSALRSRRAVDGPNETLQNQPRIGGRSAGLERLHDPVGDPQ